MESTKLVKLVTLTSAIQAMEIQINVYVEVNSVQAAYTMGGASVRVASSTGENVGWSAGKNQNTTTVSLGLAF